MIYYSDGSCSTTYTSSKTVAGIVVKDNELVMSQIASSTMAWGTYSMNISGLTDYGSDTEAKTDDNGKSNTAAIIAGDSGVVAAKYCNDYTTAGTGAGDWYLPAAGELYSYVYGNYSTINTTMTTLGWSWGGTYYYFWSSSEYGRQFAWVVNLVSGVVRYDVKDEPRANSVSCFLNI